MKQTKISKALAYLAEHPGSTPSAAARHAQISPAQLSRRLKLDKAQQTGVCPVCGRANDDDAVKVTLTLRRSEITGIEGTYQIPPRE